MNKLLVFILLTVVAFGAVAEGKNPVSFEGGAGISFAMVDDKNATDMDQFAAFILSLRGGIYGEALFNLTDVIGIGGQVGVYYITWGKEPDTITFVDFPIRALVEADLAGLKLSGFAGYYLSVGFPGLSGPELGAKVDFGGLYFQGSSVISPELATIRVEAGVSVGL